MEGGAGETSGEFPFQHLFPAPIPGRNPVP
jgi:hypothetical protein